MIFLLLALIAGALLPLQAAANAALRIAFNSPIWAAFTSFFIGTCCLAVYALVSKEPFPRENLAEIAAWKWMGGLLGAIFLTLVILLTPKLGAATTFGLIIAGQLIAAVVLDHFGVLGIPVHTLTVPRAIGVLMMMAGVFLVRKF